MHLMARGFLFFVVALGALALGYYARTSSESPDTRRDAAQVLLGATLEDLAGKPQPLAQWRGQVMVVNFWATWCPPCRESIPHLNELHAKYKDRGLVIMGVTDEPSGVIRKFQRDTPMDYAVGTDSGGRLNKEMGVEGIPHAFLADASGKIVWDGHPMSLREEQIEEVLGGGREQSAAEPAENPAADSGVAVAAATSSPSEPAATPASEPAAAVDSIVLQAED